MKTQRLVLSVVLFFIGIPVGVVQATSYVYSLSGTMSYSGPGYSGDSEIWGSMVISDEMTGTAPNYHFEILDFTFGFDAYEFAGNSSYGFSSIYLYGGPPVDWVDSELWLLDTTDRGYWYGSELEFFRADGTSYNLSNYPHSEWDQLTLAPSIEVYGFGRRPLGDVIFYAETLQLECVGPLVVPEPSSMFLVGIGLVSFAGIRKKFTKGDSIRHNISIQY